MVEVGKEEEEMWRGGLLDELVSGYNDIYADLNSLHLRTKKFCRGGGETNRCEGEVGALREKLDQLELRQSRVREGLGCELEREDFERRIGWRFSHLQGKLAVVESLLERGSNSVSSVETSIGVEVEALTCWLDEVEMLLPPVQWRVASRWSGQRRRLRLDRLRELGEEIERRGRGVSLMVAECQEARSNQMVNEMVEEASLLEGRWQAAWLTCLEWQCLLEQLVKVEEIGQGEKEEEEVEEALVEKEVLTYTSSCLDYHLLECDDDKSENDSLDEAYSSLSLSDILAARDLSCSTPGKGVVMIKGKKVEEGDGEGEEEEGDNGSDSGVSELSQETTPEPVEMHLRVRGVKKERLRGRRRKEQAPLIKEEKRVKKQGGGGVSSFWLVFGLLGAAVIFFLADHIVCCDTVCAIALTPLLKYTNGPPPL